MKTLVDYLKNKQFSDYIGKHHIALQLDEDNVIMQCDNNKYIIEIYNTTPECEMQDILEEEYRTEVRFCEICGKPYDAGYIAGDGDWYCCEDCFESAMNNDYGKGRWRATEHEGYYGGYYEYFDGNEWEDTSIYYTEWN